MSEIRTAEGRQSRPVAASRRGNHARGWGETHPLVMSNSSHPRASQLNRWLLMRRRAAVQRPPALAPKRRCKAPAAPVSAVDRTDRLYPVPGYEASMHQSAEGGLLA